MTSTLSKEQLHYVCIAMQEAQKSELRCKHGSVIAKGTKIISQGHNKYTGYNRHGSSLMNGKRTIHAEVDAINNCSRKKNMKGADLYVVRFNVRTHSVSNSEPCHNCKQYIDSCIKKYGLNRVYYTSCDIDINESSNNQFE